MLRFDYKHIAELARRTGEPVYITKNGTPEVVVMHPKAFAARDKVLKLANVILEEEYKRQDGTESLSVADINALIEKELDKDEEEKSA